jgi:type III secretion system-like peptide-binding chaperone
LGSCAIKQNPDLFQFLLRRNREEVLGAFSLGENGNVYFEHSLLGSTLQKEELRATLYAVTRTADEYDDRIVNRWGGLRACEVG